MRRRSLPSLSSFKAPRQSKVVLNTKSCRNVVLIPTEFLEESSDLEEHAHDELPPILVSCDSLMDCKPFKVTDSSHNPTSSSRARRRLSSGSKPQSVFKRSVPVPARPSIHGCICGREERVLYQRLQAQVAAAAAAEVTREVQLYKQHQENSIATMRQTLELLKDLRVQQTGIQARVDTMCAESARNATLIASLAARTTARQAPCGEETENVLVTVLNLELEADQLRKENSRINQLLCFSLAEYAARFDQVVSEESSQVLPCS